MGIEPTSSAWKAEVIAIIRCPHPGTRLPDFSVDFKDGEKDCSSLNSSPFVPATSVTWRELFEGFHLPRSVLDSALPLGVIQCFGSKMVVGEGLFVTSFLTRWAALKRVVSFHETRTLSKVLTLPRSVLVSTLPLGVTQSLRSNMVVGEGFEPSKSVTADLQSAPFGRSGTPPDFNYFILEWCRLPESNW